MEKNCDKYTGKIFELYLKYGIKSITMDEVARQLGISKKTLYQHFKDKVDLVEQTMMYTIEKHTKNIKKLQLGKMNAIEELLAINKYLNKVIEKEHNPSIDFDLQKYYLDIFKKFHEYRRKVTYESLIKNLEKGKKDGMYRANLNVEIIAAIHMARVESQMQGNATLFKKFSHQEIYNEIFTYHIRGICSRKGIDFYENKLKENINQNLK